jgi:hypothetical protein
LKQAGKSSSWKFRGGRISAGTFKGFNPDWREVASELWMVEFSDLAEVCLEKQLWGRVWNHQKSNIHPFIMANLLFLHKKPLPHRLFQPTPTPT